MSQSDGAVRSGQQSEVQHHQPARDGSFQGEGFLHVRPSATVAAGANEINQNRRRFFGAAALTVAAAQLGIFGATAAQASELTSAVAAGSKSGGNTSFASLKQIDAGLLNVGYAEAGPASGPAVILLHGWPYDLSLIHI